MGQRLILYFFCLAFSSMYCQESIKTFSFISFGPNFRETVTVSQDSTLVDRIVSKDSFSKRTLTPNETWGRLKNAIAKYSLEDLQKLPSPTSERASDGANYSYINISTDKNVYFSGEFDNYNPNERLKDLLVILLENLK